jgi:hypothetical protein
MRVCPTIQGRKLTKVEGLERAVAIDGRAAVRLAMALLCVVLIDVQGAPPVITKDCMALHRLGYPKFN